MAQGASTPNDGAASTGDPGADSRGLLREAWSNARAIIEEENEIANHRLTALISINSLAFVAHGVAVTCLVTKSHTGYGIMGAFFVALLASIIGFCCAWSCGPTIRAAYRQIHAANDWWHRFQKSLQPGETTGYATRHPFPPITGRNARHRFIRFREAKPSQGGGSPPTTLYESNRFIWFLRFQKDDPYKDFELDERTDPAGSHLLDEAQDPPQYGLPKWANFLRWIWVLIFGGTLVCLGIYLWQEPFRDTSSPGAVRVEIVLDMDPNAETAVISLRADPNAIRALVEQSEPHVER